MPHSDRHSYKIIYSGILKAARSGRICLILLVGAGRFERPTPCAQGRCATRLRYAPTLSTLLILKCFSGPRNDQSALVGRVPATGFGADENMPEREGSGERARGGPATV